MEWFWHSTDRFVMAMLSPDVSLLLKVGLSVVVAHWFTLLVRSELKLTLRIQFTGLLIVLILTISRRVGSIHVWLSHLDWDTVVWILTIEFKKIWIGLPWVLIGIELLLLLLEYILLWVLMCTLRSTFNHLIHLCILLHFLLIHLILLLHLMVDSRGTVLWIYLLLNLLNVLDTCRLLMFALSHVWLCCLVAQVWIETNTTVLYDRLLLLHIWIDLVEIDTLSAYCLINPTMLGILLIESL